MSENNNQFNEVKDCETIIDGALPKIKKNKKGICKEKSNGTKRISKEINAKVIGYSAVQDCAPNDSKKYWIEVIYIHAGVVHTIKVKFVLKYQKEFVVTKDPADRAANMKKIDLLYATNPLRGEFYEWKLLNSDRSFEQAWLELQNSTFSGSALHKEEV